LPLGAGTSSRIAAGLARGGSGPRARVEHGELELLLAGIEVDEQIVDLVQDLLNARIRPVDLVDDDDRRQLPLESLAQHEPGLRQWSFRGVDQQQHAVHHRERALHLTAEIRVARGVHDIDQDAPIVHRRVLGEDGDAALALEIGIVHRALRDALVLAEDPALVQHRVDQRGLPVIHVRDDRDVAPERVGHRRGALRVRRHPFSIPRGQYGAAR
jgi:hypothetical protein